VVAFLSQAHLEPDLTLEVFFVDGPLEGFGSLEVVPGAEPAELFPGDEPAEPA
jgi:hypothetical protein